jgi:hypothetical protein
MRRKFYAELIGGEHDGRLVRILKKRMKVGIAVMPKPVPWVEGEPIPIGSQWNYEFESYDDRTGRARFILKSVFRGPMDLVIPNEEQEGESNDHESA